MVFVSSCKAQGEQGAAVPHSHIIISKNSITIPDYLKCPIAELMGKLLLSV